MERVKSVVRPRHQYKLIKGAENLREIEAIPLPQTNQKSLRKIFKRSDLGQFPAWLIRFGPVYYAVDSSMESAKEEAWNQVLRRSPDKHEETMEFYLSAIRRVEKKARDAYDGEALVGFTESEFRWMMIKDGCFFLQLVFFILGASEELGYPDNHIIFGKKRDKNAVYRWMKSMFYAGNQIPLLVLNEFMKQTFFLEVIDREKWERPTDLLSKGVLYDLLILPAKNGGSKMPGGSAYLSEEQPSDLLHGLQNLLVGKRISRNNSNEEEDEEEEEEGHDLESEAKLDTIKVVVDNDGIESSVSSLRIKGIYLGKSNGAGIRGIRLDNVEDGEDYDGKKRCVSEFRKKGIHFWKLNGAGIRGMQFKNHMLYANLYLPKIPLNQDTDMLLNNLKYYEDCQQQNEVRSYLGFMKHIISTYEDVNHLASKGIFEVSKPYYKERFLKMLKSMSFEETTINHDHRYILQQLRDYSSFPWEYFKYVAILVFIFTVLQTVFGVLSYVIGVKQLHKS